MKYVRLFAGISWLLVTVVIVASFLHRSAASNGLMGGIMPLTFFAGIAVVILGAFFIGRLFDFVESFFEVGTAANESPVVSVIASASFGELDTFRIVYSSCVAYARDARPLRKSEVITLDSYSGRDDLVRVMGSSVSLTTRLIRGATIRSCTSEDRWANVVAERPVSIASWSL